MDSQNQTLIKGKRISTEPVGWLLGRFGLLVILALLILAAWNGHTVIVMLLGVVLAAAALSKLWSRFSLAGVSCERFLSQRRLFPGERLDLKLRLVNRKLLPLPWIQVDNEMPLGFTPDVTSGEASRSGTGFFSKSTALLWYTAAKWHCELECKKRGYFQIGPITLTSGDVFGFYPCSVTEPLIDHIIVYPEIFSLSELGMPSIYPVGDALAQRRIFEDPTRTSGIRDYTPFDSLRRIHWKASARQHKLKSKIYEPTTTLKVAVFLAIDSFPPVGPGAEKNFELGISVAASIANHLTKQDSPVGLFANACLADTSQPARILPASGVDHLINVLEALAKVTHETSVPFINFIEREKGKLPWGTTLVFVLSQVAEFMHRIFLDLKASGYKVWVIQVGNESTAEGSGVTWHVIKQGFDLARVGTGDRQ